MNITQEDIYEAYKYLSSLIGMIDNPEGVKALGVAIELLKENLDDLK